MVFEMLWFEVPLWAKQLYSIEEITASEATQTLPTCPLTQCKGAGVVPEREREKRTCI